jgi:hypothetical protein
LFKERKNKPISITLSPESKEAIEIIKKEKNISIVSQALDYALKDAVSHLGYKQGVDINMVYEIVEKTKQSLSQDKDVKVDLLIGENETLNKYLHNDELFIEAPNSGDYYIKITNNSHKRRLFVISVDGRNVLDGEPANIENGKGYVIDPFQSVNVKGWRRTSEEVAAFEFVDIESSYDKSMGGDGLNVGIIGLAIFDEKEDQWEYWKKIVQDEQPNWWPTTAPNIWPPHIKPTKYKWNESIPIWIYDSTSNNTPYSNRNYSYETISSSYSVTSESVTSNVIGTAYGKPVEMPTKDVSFIKNSSKPRIVEIRYATRDLLIKWGVIPTIKMPKLNAFPKTESATPEPENWKYKNLI